MPIQTTSLLPSFATTPCSRVAVRGAVPSPRPREIVAVVRSTVHREHCVRRADDVGQLGFSSNQHPQRHGGTLPVSAKKIRTSRKCQPQPARGVALALLRSLGRVPWAFYCRRSGRGGDLDSQEDQTCRGAARPRSPPPTTSRCGRTAIQHLYLLTDSSLQSPPLSAKDKVDTPSPPSPTPCRDTLRWQAPFTPATRP